MSSPDSDRFLKAATFLAIIVAIVGGSFYFGAMMDSDDDSEEPVRIEVRARSAASTGAEESRTAAGVQTPAPEAPPADTADPPIQRMRDPMSASLLSMATRPTILPESELASVEEEMALALPDLDGCWRGAVGENATEAKVFVHFTVDDNGEVADLNVRSKGIGVPSANPCFEGATKKRVFGNTEPGTSVYWPIILDPESGPRLR